MHAQSLSLVWLFATPRTVPTRLLCPWDSPGKNTGVGCHALLQGIFPTQGSNLRLLHWMWILYLWATWESPLRNIKTSKPYFCILYVTKSPKCQHACPILSSLRCRNRETTAQIRLRSQKKNRVPPLGDSCVTSGFSMLPLPLGCGCPVDSSVS